jgi:hypothetical protein
VLGRNASTELGVPTCGAARHDNAREGGLNEEANLIRAKNGFPKMSEAYAIQAAGEKNLTVFNNCRVIGVEMADKAISSVKAVNTLTLAPGRVKGAFFIDCTGDGWVGYYAGAGVSFRARGEQRVRRGCRAGAGRPHHHERLHHGQPFDWGYRAEIHGPRSPYSPPTWGPLKLPPPEIFHRTPRGWADSGGWASGRFSTTSTTRTGARRADPHQFRVVGGWIKNDWADKDKAPKLRHDLCAAPFDARRENASGWSAIHSQAHRIARRARCSRTASRTAGEPRCA